MGDLGLILGWEDPLEKGTATHSPWGHKESDTEQLSGGLPRGCDSVSKDRVLLVVHTWP